MNHDFRAQLFGHVVDAYGAADALNAAIKTDPRGRKRRSNARTFLILLLLAAADGDLTIENMHRIALLGLGPDVQEQLGITRRNGDAVTPMPLDELYYLTRVITTKLATTGAHTTQLTDEQRHGRRCILEDIVDRLLRGTLPDRPGSSYALDESAIWAWAKGRRRHLPTRRTDEAAADGDVEPTAQRFSACPDARWGTKTGKNGEQDAYFGYALHALVRVPDLRPGPAFSDEDDPVLIEAIAVTPAATDVVDVSVALLDRVRERRPVRDLVADRHYSYKEWSRWAYPLWERGIRPVLDLREDEHGFRSYKGTKIAASWPHCPATPNRLGTLPRPGTNAAAADRARFEAAIEERESYAMRRVKSHIPDAASRWECPARAGKIGCPRVEDTVQVAHELQLPIVANPPADDPLPVCCTQRTFMIRAEPPEADDDARTRQAKQRLGQTMKHAQDEYWGSHRWTSSWNRRTYVEGAFGNLKNPSTENLRRGTFRFTGLPLVTLAVAASVAACNVRQLRNWDRRTGDGDGDGDGDVVFNPLLAPEPPLRLLLRDDDATAPQTLPEAA